MISVTEMESGISDEVVLSTANSHEAMLVAEAKDFGELVFRRSLVHQGVILLRLAEDCPYRQRETGSANQGQRLAVSRR